MSWPIPVFLNIEYPKPISLRVWLPTLVSIASATAAAVLLVWPQGKPTNTVLFWATLVGAPLVACFLLLGWRLKQWEDEQKDAEDAEKEQHWLKKGWRDWSRRQACVIDVAAFPAATDEIDRFSAEKFDLPTNIDRSITFDWVSGRTAAFRRTRLLRLVALRFAEALRDRREVIITLMLDDTSLKQDEDWTKQVMRTFGSMIPALRVEVHPATGGVQWMTQLVDRVDPATRLVIAAQLWADEEEKHNFSEGAAAFLVEAAATNAGLIFRPMTSVRDTMEVGLGQIREFQMAPDRLKHVWVANCEHIEATAIRSALAPDPKEMPDERLLDGVLGTPGPASGWIALAVAMEAMRGARPQLVAWREPQSECLYLCTVSPMPQKETSV
ncbi:hypothetical protein LMG27952_06168 [Paraburkholderia hiiakae]|uniref:Uncharacterized protein n=1 Tax=Paraburkholderia hiiakae TaxID=1081782 RepID=A0ABM8P590_9BURK|nr:hypothetical protein [Paraburkholderia hiiakae]CAD6556681.1 hypothetical protein LMG27952_06168 [Paraburkholderia hiiakae]